MLQLRRPVLPTAQGTNAAPFAALLLSWKEQACWWLCWHHEAEALELSLAPRASKCAGGARTMGSLLEVLLSASQCRQRAHGQHCSLSLAPSYRLWGCGDADRERPWSCSGPLWGDQQLDDRLPWRDGGKGKRTLLSLLSALGGTRKQKDLGPKSIGQSSKIYELALRLPCVELLDDPHGSLSGQDNCDLSPHLQSLLYKGPLLPLALVQVLHPR